MDERKLTEDQLEETSGGGLSETLNYALEQGKKVAAVLSDTLDLPLPRGHVTASSIAEQTRPR